MCAGFFEMPIITFISHNVIMSALIYPYNVGVYIFQINKLIN